MSHKVLIPFSAFFESADDPPRQSPNSQRFRGTSRASSSRHFRGRPLIDRLSSRNYSKHRVHLIHLCCLPRPTCSTHRSTFVSLRASEKSKRSGWARRYYLRGSAKFVLQLAARFTNDIIWMARSARTRRRAHPRMPDSARFWLTIRPAWSDSWLSCDPTCFGA